MCSKRFPQRGSEGTLSWPHRPLTCNGLMEYFLTPRVHASRCFSRPRVRDQTEKGTFAGPEERVCAPYIMCKKWKMKNEKKKCLIYDAPPFRGFRYFPLFGSHALLAVTGPSLRARYSAEKYRIVYRRFLFLLFFNFRPRSARSQ